MVGILDTQSDAGRWRSGIQSTLGESERICLVAKRIYLNLRSKNPVKT